MDNPKLTPVQYWKWRFFISEMQLADRDLNNGALKYEMMLKDQEIYRLKCALFKTSLNSLEDARNIAKKNYEEVKAEIEKKLGVSLSGCTIDDITFEVKKLEE